MRPTLRLPTRRGWLLWPAALLLAAACASPGGPQAAADGRVRIWLTVENGVDRDVRVYLLRGGSPIPLGSVASLTSRTFRISPALLPGLAPLRLRGMALGGGTIESAELIVNPGDRVVWGLGPRLQHSRLWIR